MCRMVGVVSVRPGPLRQWLVDAPHSLRAMSLRGQKAPHRDGFGYAYRDGRGRMRIFRWGKEGLSAAGEGLPGDLALASDLVVAHLRKASPEFAGRRGGVDAHPLVYGGLVLAHNGTIRDAQVLDPGPGTDSQRLVRWLAQRWTDGALSGLAQALEDLLGIVQDYTAINLLLTRSQGLFAFCCFRQDPEYYTLHCKKTPEHVIVASEPVDQSPDWQALSNGVVLEVQPNLAVAQRRVKGA